MSLSAETFLAAQDLVLRFWAVVDEVDDTPGADLFTPEGALAIESFRAEGTAELSRYFAARRTLSTERQRSTRHLCTNLRALPGAGTRLAATVTVFSGTGAHPLPLQAPSSLADFTFDCVATPDGWRFREVRGVLIFAGADTPDLKKAAQAAKGVPA
ncbi:nuclear transport factor 2 family protein [Tropicibacter alexandrii]|uniref:nuclear transport factor 2 family protein n=1 Tax=Tropicibacter alexandrii TaxID=2267683 RepID=UPI000EF531C2|nr:nuclear transport factor 2 family protein [Tropicibacter alexandrii]